MNKKKINQCIVLAALILLLLAYYKEYSIVNSENVMTKTIQSFISSDDVKVVKKIDLDNKAIVLFTYQNKSMVGCAKLKRGINGRYKIQGANTGDAFEFVRDYVDTNRGRYFVFLGKNFDYKINSIRFKDNISPVVQYGLPHSEFFMLILDISNKIDIALHEYEIYDKNNKEMTKDIVKAYFSQQSETGHAIGVEEVGFLNQGAIVTIALFTLILVNAENYAKK
jgi:hypothetical protein